LPNSNGERPEVDNSEGDFQSWVDETSELAADMRERIKEFDVLVEYPQRQYLVPDAKLYAVLENIASGHNKSIPRHRRRQIFDEFRLRSEFPESPEPIELEGILIAAFEEADDADDFDEIRPSFESRIKGIICAGESHVVVALADLIEQSSTNCELSAVALETIGSMWNPPTHRDRRLLLEKSLGNKDRTIRTGAVFGLSDLSDPLSLPALIAAHEIESDDVLKSTIFETINQLEVLKS